MNDGNRNDGTATTTERAFDADTRVDQRDDGRFEATFSDRWNALGGTVNGGYSAAVCLQALRQVLPHPDPLAVSSFFLRPGAPGPVEVRTDVGRRGRRVSTGEARLYQEGREIVRTTATFTDLDGNRGPTSVFAGRPALPEPEEAIDPVGEASLPGVTMTDHVEYRYPELPPWCRDHATGDPDTTFWMRFTDGRAADTLSLPMLVDGAAPVVLNLGVPGSSTLELTTHVRARPAPGWLACRATTRYVIDGYHEEDFEIWDRRNKLVAQARQLALIPTA